MHTEHLGPQNYYMFPNQVGSLNDYNVQTRFFVKTFYEEVLC